MQRVASPIPAVLSLGFVALAAVAPPAAAQLVFEPPVPHAAGMLGGRVYAGDVDEDGVPDALVGHDPFIFQPLPALLPGQGDGGFATAQFLDVGTTGTDTRGLADFDGDGHLDLITVGGAVLAPFTASVWRGHGDGTFSAPVGINGNHLAANDVDVGDFNADGALDAGIVGGMTGFTPGSVVAALGHGDGSFEPGLDVVAGVQFAKPRLRVGDLDGNGLDDLVFTASLTGSVRLSLGDGSFAAPAGGSATVGEVDLALADLDGDGREDVVTPTQVLMALPSGGLAIAQNLPSGLAPTAVALGDLDGDGELDAAVGRSVIASADPGVATGDLHVMRGLGDGTLATSGLVVSQVPKPHGLALADLDLDGRLDLLAGSFQFTGGTLRSLLNHTYAPGSPFTDLGSALAGSLGLPIQLAEGSLVGGEPFEFRLANGPASGSAWHVVGTGLLAAPFKGGVLVPTPDLVNGPLPLDPTGSITLAGLWPTGASGLTIFLQFWAPDAGGPKGFSASSGLQAELP